MPKSKWSHIISHLATYFDVFKSELFKGSQLPVYLSQIVGTVARRGGQKWEE